MDWVDALHETPDLCGEIEVLDYRAIFIGHYSCVYKGEMKSTGELVAIKVLNSIRGTGVSTMRRKIERERKTWSSLKHLNILPLYGFADDHDLFTPFGAFISPWRSRGDLGEFLIEEGENTPLRVRLQLWQGVVAGVHHLHSHQPLLVHGDLKPGNVLIDDDGNAQLCDFGLVRVYLNEGHSGMTTASPHCGTERYLAWELVMAEEDAIPTAASDIYATGCIGLETLFLTKPYSRYRNNVRWHIRSDMQEGNPPAVRPTNLESQLDSLWEILSQCWAHDPLPRPHAHHLLKDVANILNRMDSEEQSCKEIMPQFGPSSPQTLFESYKATETPSEILVDDSEDSIPTDFSLDPNGGHSKVYELEAPFGIDLMVHQGRRTGMPRDESDDGNDRMEIDEACDNDPGERKAQLATFIQTELVGNTGRVPASISTTLYSQHGPNTPAAGTSPLTNPDILSSSTASGRVGSDRPKQYHTSDAPRHAPRASRFQSVLMAAATAERGMDMTKTVPAPISSIRRSRRGSNTELVVTSPLMNSDPPSSFTTSGHIGSGRPELRHISDAPRHTPSTSRSQSVLLAAATTQVSMDTNPIWNPHPFFDDLEMGDYPANLGSETSAGHAPYPYGRSQLTFTDPLAAPPVPANGEHLSQGRGEASMSPYSSRSSIGLAGSLQRSPASTGADSQVYSHNQHGDRYNHIAPGSQYVHQESLRFVQLAQPTHVEAMPTNLQRHQLADTMYTPEPQAHYYRSPHSHSPASPMLPLRSSPQQTLYHHPYAGPNITVTPFTTVEEIVKLNQVSYLPPQNHLQSPLPAVSFPSDMSEPPERHSPTLQSRRVPGQRSDVDGEMLENSFRGNDDQSRMRRQLLDDIQRQSWFHLNQDEPKLGAHLHRDILKHGLGMVGRSVYTVFLVEDKDSNQWRCLFGSEEVSCKKADKRFERVERAIEHVRIHLGHRPFACDGTCHKARLSGINCGKRFFAAGYLEDHKKRPPKRTNGDSDPYPRVGASSSGVNEPPRGTQSNSPVPRPGSNASSPPSLLLEPVMRTGGKDHAEGSPGILLSLESHSSRPRPVSTIPASWKVPASYSNLLNPAGPVKPTPITQGQGRAMVTCSICGITTSARNMGRHRKTRHPNHIEHAEEDQGRETIQPGN